MFIVKDTTTGLYLNTKYRRRWSVNPATGKFRGCWDERKYARVYRTIGAVQQALAGERGRMNELLWPELSAELSTLVEIDWLSRTDEQRQRGWELAEELNKKWSALSSIQKFEALTAAGFVVIPVEVKEVE